MSDVIETLKMIQDLYERIERLKKMLTGEELAQIVRTIGENQFKTALRNFEDMGRSGNPERELRMGLTNLTSALTAYSNTGINASKRFFQQRLTPNAVVNDYRQAFLCATLIAVCYRLEGEARLVSDYTRQAENFFDSYVVATQYSASPGMRVVGDHLHQGLSIRDPAMVRVKREFESLRELLARIQNRPPLSPDDTFGFVTNFATLRRLEVNRRSDMP